MPTLADLITARRAERGWSYADLEVRANHSISRQRWQQLGTGVRIKEFPEPANIKAMSDALEIGVASVVLATARSVGLDIPARGSALGEMLPTEAAELSTTQRDAVLAVVRAMRETEGARDEAQEPRPKASGTLDGGEGGTGAPIVSLPIAPPDATDDEGLPWAADRGPSVGRDLLEAQEREWEQDMVDPPAPDDDDLGGR